MTTPKILTSPIGTLKDDQPSLNDEDGVQMQIEACLAEIRKNGGWGSITLDYRGGDLHEIGLLLTKRPQKRVNYKP
jgi:hypothetical protein